MASRSGKTVTKVKPVAKKSAESVEPVVPVDESPPTLVIGHVDVQFHMVPIHSDGIGTPVILPVLRVPGNEWNSGWSTERAAQVLANVIAQLQNPSAAPQG